MAIIPPFFMDAVVALGVELPNHQKHWVGTGFLVVRREQTNPDFSTVYIITNKHVVNNQGQVYVRFNNNDATGVKDLLLQLANKDGEKFYSEHPHLNVDIVAIQVLPQVIMDNHSSLSFFDLDTHALILNQMQSTGVDEGSLVYALGFPMNLVNDSVKAPICRLGCISRVADAFVNPQTAVAYLVDAQTFPGNSGGPIVNRPEYVSIDGTPKNTSANLIGILSAYIPYRETLYSRQTGRDRMIQEENSGITIVHPVDRIKEVVELEWARIEELKTANNDADIPAPQETKEEVAV